jgi:23S rRNA pseudouridine1911/1915/1917 synthase
LSRLLQHRVRTEEQGQRLDRLLAAAWPELTRSRIQALLRAGKVTVDGRAAKPSDQPRPGASIEAEIPDPEPTHLVAEQRVLDIVFEDEFLLVVNKPAGLVVHPGAGVRHGTLVHALLGHCPGIQGVGGVARPGLVHRLDKDTSGLLVVAKTDAAFQALTRDLALRRVRRSYVALVWGVPRPAEGRIEAAIGRDRKDRKRMAVLPAGRRGARPAATRYRVLAELPTAAARPRFAWLGCELETGRTHQIRVHLAHRGYPVVADATYGGGVRKALSLPPADRTLASHVVAGLKRQALHAAALEFRHPVHGGALVFRAPLPADLAGALAALGMTDPPVFP